MQVKAAVLHEAGQPLSIEDVEVLPPLRGEVQVRTEAINEAYAALERGEVARSLVLA